MPKTLLSPRIPTITTYRSPNEELYKINPPLFYSTKPNTGIVSGSIPGRPGISGPNGLSLSSYSFPYPPVTSQQQTQAQIQAQGAMSVQQNFMPYVYPTAENIYSMGQNPYAYMDPNSILPPGMSYPYTDPNFNVGQVNPGMVPSVTSDPYGMYAWPAAAGVGVRPGQYAQMEGNYGPDMGLKRGKYETDGRDDKENN